MYYEIFHDGNLILRDNRYLLSDLSWDNELMYTPTLSVTFPAFYLEYIQPFNEVKVHVNNKVFWGIITDFDVDEAEETIDITLDHIVHEWEFREISVNNAIKEKNLNIIYQEKKKETVISNTKTRTNKAVQWYRNHMGKVTYSMSSRYGPTSYDCSSALYNALLSAGELENVQVGTTATLARDLKAKGWKATTKEPQRGDVFVWTAGTAGQEYGHCGMFTSKDKIIHCNASANGISENTFGYTWATIYHNPKADKQITTKKTIETIEEIDPKVVDQIENIYEDANFAYPGWGIEFSELAKKEKIDYVYSRQNKLEALTQTCKLTDSLFWRVGFVDDKVIEISEFGEKKPYICSLKPKGITNIQILTEPKIDYDFSSVTNVASVYSAKSDSGMSSLTMREIYEDESLQIDGFPVIILKPSVNNERDYSKYIKQPKAVAPNNELEFAVLDLEGIAEAGGYLIESSYSFNDISPFSQELDAVDSSKKKTTTIKNKDRVLAAKQAYKATIKKLKASRVKYKIEVETSEIPSDINVGDMVRVIYDNNVLILESCTNYMKKILAYDDYFYITKISYNIDSTGQETDTLTFSKELDLDREEVKNSG